MLFFQKGLERVPSEWGEDIGMYWLSILDFVKDFWFPIPVFLNIQNQAMDQREAPSFYHEHQALTKHPEAAPPLFDGFEHRIKQMPLPLTRLRLPELPEEPKKVLNFHYW